MCSTCFNTLSTDKHVLHHLGVAQKRKKPKSAFTLSRNRFSFTIKNPKVILLNWVWDTTECSCTTSNTTHITQRLQTSRKWWGKCKEMEERERSLINMQHGAAVDWSGDEFGDESENCRILIAECESQSHTIMNRWLTVSDRWGRKTQQIGVDADDKII